MLGAGQGPESSATLQLPNTEELIKASHDILLSADTIGADSCTEVFAARPAVRHVPRLVAPQDRLPLPPRAPPGLLGQGERGGSAGCSVLCIPLARATGSRAGPPV